MAPPIKGLGPKVDTQRVRLVEEEELPLVPDFQETAEVDVISNNEESFQSCNSELELEVDGPDHVAADMVEENQPKESRLCPTQPIAEPRRSTRERKAPEFYQSQ